MLTAGFNREERLLRVCAQLETARPWAAREPGLIAARGARTSAS